MADSVEYAAQHGIQAIIQPGGSIKDQASIDLANHYGIAMILLGLVISNINFKGETDEYISDWAWWS